MGRQHQAARRRSDETEVIGEVIAPADTATDASGEAVITTNLFEDAEVAAMLDEAESLGFTPEEAAKLITHEKSWNERKKMTEPQDLGIAPE